MLTSNFKSILVGLIFDSKFKCSKLIKIYLDLVVKPIKSGSNILIVNNID